MVAATSEDQTIMVTSVGQVATETSEVHRVTEVLVVAETLEVQTVTEARREDLREPLQTADAETGPTKKVVPTIV